MRRDERSVSDIRLIEDIIQKADVCRIAFANENTPYMVTMNFGYTSLPGQTLYFHCANEGRKIEMIKSNNYVCFEMDVDHQLKTGPDGCDWGMKYRSVVGYGYISIIADQDQKRTGLDCIMKHYGGTKEYTYNPKVFDRTTILKLDIKEMTGKKC